MPILIKITVEQLALFAELNESPSARLFLELLPLSFSMNRWGEEYYGDCGIQAEESADARVIMEIGELAIWPPGHAFCIFFGPTPVSVDDRPQAASKVNPIGRLIDDPAPLKKLGPTIKVHIERKKTNLND